MGGKGQVRGGLNFEVERGKTAGQSKIIEGVGVNKMRSRGVKFWVRGDRRSPIPLCTCVVERGLTKTLQTNTGP